MNEQDTSAEADLFEWLVSNTIAVFGPASEMRAQWRSELVQLNEQAKQQQVPDLPALLDALIALLDAKGDPTGLGTNLTGNEALVWQKILSYLSIQEGQ